MGGGKVNHLCFPSVFSVGRKYRQINMSKTSIARGIIGLEFSLELGLEENVP